MAKTKTLTKEAKSGADAIEVVKKFLSKKNRSKYIALDNAKLLEVNALTGKVKVECVYSWDVAVGGVVKIKAGNVVLCDKAFEIPKPAAQKEMNDLFSEMGF